MYILEQLYYALFLHEHLHFWPHLTSVNYHNLYKFFCIMCGTGIHCQKAPGKQRNSTIFSG